MWMEFAGLAQMKVGKQSATNKNAKGSIKKKKKLEASEIVFVKCERKCCDPS